MAKYTYEEKCILRTLIDKELIVLRKKFNERSISPQEEEDMRMLYQILKKMDIHHKEIL